MTAYASRNWVVGGALATAVAIVASGTATWSWAAARPRPKTAYQTAVYEHQVDRVELDLGAGDIRLSAGDLAVQRRLHWRTSKPVVHEEWRGTTLRISAHGPGDSAVDYTIQLPAGVPVTGTTGAGNLAASGLTSEVRLTTGAGTTTLDHLAGPLWIHSKGGGVTGSALRSAETDIDTGEGEVDLGYTAAPTTVRAVTGEGDVSITVPDVPGYRVAAQTEEGTREVTVREDADGPHAISATTGEGNITVGYGP